MTPFLRLFSVVLLAACLTPLWAFHVPLQNPFRPVKGDTLCFSSNLDKETELVVSLKKPLGIILEEAVEGEAMGAVVAGLGEGSASSSEFKDELVGLHLASVMNEDVRNLNFDDVMARIVDAPLSVTLRFQTLDLDNAPASSESQFSAGTTVVIKILDDGSEKIVEGKVGDNLRSTLLENNVEVYKGLKQKLGNW